MAGELTTFRLARENLRHYLPTSYKKLAKAIQKIRIPSYIYRLSTMIKSMAAQMMIIVMTT